MVRRCKRLWASLAGVTHVDGDRHAALRDAPTRGPPGRVHDRKGIAPSRSRYVQLLILYHLVTAGAKVALGGAGADRARVLT
jgi:hypothetical protein